METEVKGNWIHSNVKEKQRDMHSRRMSFHSPPKLPLGFNIKSNQRVHTPIIKGKLPLQPLTFQKKHSWATPGSSQGAKKINTINKENMYDIDKFEAPKVSRFDLSQNKEVLQFSKNKSKRRVKTLHSSKTVNQRPGSNFCPFVSPFQQPISKTPNQTNVSFQDFEIIRKIGKGKFGHVFCALHKKLNFICAIKMMSKQKVKKQKYEQQIVEQIKIQFTLSHKNIVSLYGFFSDEQNIYLIMEYCNEGDVYSLLRKKKKIDQKQASKLLKQTLQGLTYLHRNNILHRDFKPQNVMIEQGIIKIGDFGWAASCQNGLRKTFCGTPLYLSPQILLGEEYDQRIDIWAFGIFAYQMMVGSNPFQIKTQGHLQRIIDDEIQFPVDTQLSLIARDFIERILQKNAKYRMDGEQLLLHPFMKGQ